MRTKIVYALLAIVTSFSANAQTDSVTYYVKNYHQQVSTIDSANYSLVVVNAGKKRQYVVHEYYKNGKLRLITNALSNQFDPLYEGKYQAFFPGGTLMRTGEFRDGIPEGHEASYYPNGKFYKSITYLPEAKISYDELNDPAGKVLAKSGNGNWIEFDESFKDTIASGKIKGGVKTGIWEEKIADNLKQRIDHTKDTQTLTEYFCKIDGVSFVKLDEGPSFPGGMMAFYKQAAKIIRYPAYAREHGIQGKVLIGFKVNEKGELSDFKILHSVWIGIDQEAMRAVKASPPWKPAMIGGKAVSVPFSVPISFALAND
ncbi:MAG: TonB family protein [Bacteroidota bacterium]